MNIGLLNYWPNNGKYWLLSHNGADTTKPHCVQGIYIQFCDQSRTQRRHLLLERWNFKSSIFAHCILALLPSGVHKLEVSDLFWNITMWNYQYQPWVASNWLLFSDWRKNMKSPSSKSVEVEISRIIASFLSRSNRKAIMVDSIALQGGSKETESQK